LDEHGLAAIQDVAELFFMRSDLKIAPTVPEIEPLLRDAPNLRYVGYLLYDRLELAPLPQNLLDQARGQNVVFVYFSAGEIGPAQYTRVIPEAFDGTEFHAIVAVGDHPELSVLPQSTSAATWVRHIPGRSILKESQALIFHGGQNTAMASLIHKVPSLAYPGADFERDFNARALARIGAGLHCPVEDFTPEKVLASTREVVSGSYRLAAEACSRKILGQGGPRYAADLVFQAAQGDLNEAGG
jgi:UDP:flavonoid glycosyltransferase YjiC (YdhE family)